MRNPQSWERTKALLLAQYTDEANAHIATLRESERKVIQAVCDVHGLEIQLIFLNRRYNEIFMPRNMAIYRLYHLHNGGLKYYARIMYLRPVEHTAIIAAKKTFINDVTYDDEVLKKYMKVIELTNDQQPQIRVTRIDPQRKKIYKSQQND